MHSPGGAEVTVTTTPRCCVIYMISAPRMKISTDWLTGWLLA